MRSEPTRAGFFAAGSALAAATIAAPAGAAESPEARAMYAGLARTARHRQVIAAPKINGGAALRYAVNTLNAFERTLGEGRGSVHTVCVFYGTSVCFMADDALWSRYRLFDLLDAAQDALPAFVHNGANPFVQPHGSDPRDPSITALTRRGVTWFVCDNALHALGADIARMQNQDPARTYGDLRAGLLPQAVVIPAGVAAIVLAQEMHYSLQPA